jgi:hypothetical protein
MPESLILQLANLRFSEILRFHLQILLVSHWHEDDLGILNSLIPPLTESRSREILRCDVDDSVHKDKGMFQLSERSLSMEMVRGFIPDVYDMTIDEASHPARKSLSKCTLLMATCEDASDGVLGMIANE